MYIWVLVSSSTHTPLCTWIMALTMQLGSYTNVDTHQTEQKQAGAQQDLTKRLHHVKHLGNSIIKEGLSVR